MTAAELRAVVRLGWRTARRQRKRTILVVGLVAVPVAAAVVAASALHAARITPGERVTSEFGAGAVRVDGTFLPAAARGWVAGEIHRLVPDGRVTSFRKVTVDVGGTAGSASVTDLDPTDPLTAGMVALLAGDPPRTDTEVALSSGIAADLGVAPGDRVSLQLGELRTAAYRVSGVVRDPLAVKTPMVVVTPAEMDRLAATMSTSRAPTGDAITAVWLVGGPALTPDAAAGLPSRMNSAWEGARAGFLPRAPVTPRPAQLASLPGVLYDRLSVDDVATLVAGGLTGQDLFEQAARLAEAHPETAMMSPDVSVQPRRLVLAELSSEDASAVDPSVAGTLVAALLLAEVALVAGAAYATGARRRLRELGLLAAGGATDTHLRLAVAGEGLTAGAVGAVVGLAAAAVAVGLGRPVMQQFVSRLIVGYPLGFSEVVGPAAVGVVAATAAAWFPARAVARVPVTAALRGRMPLAAPRRWVAAAGLCLAGFGGLLVAVAGTASGGLAGMQAAFGVVAIISGFALLAGPLVAAAGRFADRLPATLRLVTRDSARQRTKAAAAIAATMVVLIIPVVVGVDLASSQLRERIFGVPYAANQVLVTGQRAVTGVAAAPHVDAADLARVAAILPDAGHSPVATTDATATLSERPTVTSGAVQASPSGNDPKTMQVAVGTRQLAQLLGIPQVEDTLASGVPVVLGVADRPTRLHIGSATVDARMVAAHVALQMPRALLPPQVADRLGITPTGSMELFVNPGAPTASQRRALYDLAVGVAFITPPRFTPTQLGLAVTAGSLAVVLGIIGLITALAATESDHDLTTMVAVGAPPAIRRRFLGLQTAAYTLYAAVLAVPLGVLLAKAAAPSFIYPQTGPFGSITRGQIAIPWPLIALIAVAIPVAVGAVTAATVRSTPTTPPHRLG